MYSLNHTAYKCSWKVAFFQKNIENVDVVIDLLKKIKKLGKKSYE